jgi:hypothetical protein
MCERATDNQAAISTCLFGCAFDELDLAQELPEHPPRRSWRVRERKIFLSARLYIRNRTDEESRHAYF